MCFCLHNHVELVNIPSTWRIHIAGFPHALKKPYMCLRKVWPMFGRVFRILTFSGLTGFRLNGEVVMRLVFNYQAVLDLAIDN